MKQYKVLKQQDSFWNFGKMNAGALEDELNKYAREGWCVISCTMNNTKTLISRQSREELVIILERTLRRNESGRYEPVLD